MGNKPSGSSYKKFTKEELDAMHPAERKGHSFKSEAYAAVHKTFGKDLDLGQELYEKAATQFKLAKLPDEAAECYQEMARVQLADGDSNGAANSYVQAGETLELGKNPEGAVNAINEAVELYKDAGKFDRAGKQLMKIAEIFLKDHDEEKALQSYTDAFDIYSMDAHGASSTRKCKESMAELSAKLGKLDAAAEMFEDIGTIRTEKNITKFHAKAFFLKGILCHLARGDAIGAQEAFENANARDYTFEASSEGKFGRSIEKSFIDKDKELFQAELRARNEVKPFDDWYTSLLLQIKRQIEPLKDTDDLDDLADGGGPDIDDDLA